MVADEVRTLASRTQESTQEIQTMIEELQTGASEAAQAMDASQVRGDALVEQSGCAERTLAAIVEAGERMDEMTTRIATATEEQSTVANSISVKITEIRDTAAQARRAALDTNEASQMLEGLARDLDSRLDRFRL